MERSTWSATALTVAALLGLFVARIFAVPLDADPLIPNLAITALVVLHGLVMFRARWRTPWVLAVEAVLVFAPYLVAGEAWGPIAGVLGSAVLLTLAAPASWTVFALVLVTDAAARIVFAPDEVWMVPLGWAFVDLNVGLTLFAMARLTERVRRAGAQRRQLAALAVARDRFATARLLHAGIGTDLSAVIRLARRAASLESPAELTEIVERAKRSMAAAREIAGARREIGELPMAAPVRPVPVMFRFSWWTMLFVVLNHEVLMLANIAEFRPLDVQGWTMVGAVIAAMTALQLHHGLPRRDGSAPRAWRWTLAAQAALFAAVLTHLGILALGTMLPLLGTVVARGRAPWSWLLAGLGLAAALLMLPRPEGYPGLLYHAAAGVVTAIEIYALHRLPEVARRLNETGSELARMAVLQERLRVARDVHDLLGAGLSAIRLKAELALRLLAGEPERARREADGIRSAAERTLGEVRSITGRPAELTFRDELAATRTLLEAAGIRLTTGDGAPPVLPAEMDALLATVLREAVTNVVRHSAARTCHVEAGTHDGQVRLRVTNDGLRPATTPRPGTGLDNLTARAGEYGGHLTAGREGDLFVLTADVPVRPGVPV